MPKDAPIKVLECIRQGKIGGGESHLLSLMEHIDKSSFEPVVLSFTDGPMVNKLNQLGIKTKVIHTENPFDIRVWSKVKQWIRSERIQLAHAHGTRANSNILWACKSLSVPVIYTIHGWSFHPDQPALVRILRKLGERFLTKNSTRNISVSASNKETGLKYFKDFRSCVVNNGIDFNRFNPNLTFKDIRTELSIPADACVVSFVARLTHQKQPLLLIEAFEKAVQNNPALYLLMVGDGELAHDVKEKINNSPYRHRITLLPFRSDVPDILNAADIYVLPSLWEGLPIGLLEAMAMRRAIIASDADGTREVIEHNKNGILIPIAELAQQLPGAIESVSRSYELMQRLQQNAYLSVHQKYDAEEMTRSIESIYKEVLEN